jgi:predicted Zn-dependent protease with MMP-like domain
VNDDDRDEFDALVEEVLDELPPQIVSLLDEVPLLVEDVPPAELLKDLDVAHPLHLQGVYTGIPRTRRSVRHSATLPDRIRIFREGIAAGARRRGEDDALKHEIRRTILHEIGHHFGMKEDDLRRIGY